MKVIGDVSATLSKSDKKDLNKIESALADHCTKLSSGKIKGTRQEVKICQILDPIKRLASQPIKNGMYPDEVCKRKLHKTNSDICSVKFPIKADKDTDFSKMRVKHLKQILADRGVACKGCLEKRDYVNRVK